MTRLLTIKDKIKAVISLLRSEIAAKADQSAVNNIATNLAPEFSSSTAYHVGDCCIKSGVLFQCTAEHAAGVWNASHFERTTIWEQIQNLNN